MNFENELEPVSDETCNCICEDIGVEWRRLLRSLGVKQSVVEIIEEEKPPSAGEMLPGALKMEGNKGFTSDCGSVSSRSARDWQKRFGCQSVLRR